MGGFTATLSTGAMEYLPVDAIVTETYDDSSTITSHPVEQGADVSDNSRPEPEKLTLAVIVSNSPLPGPDRTPPPGAVDVSADDDAVAAETAYAVLMRWKNSGALLSFTTTLGDRSQMAIEKIGTVRDARTGGQQGRTGGVRISLALKYIRIVQNALTTQIVSSDLRRSPNISTGNQAATPTATPPNTALLNQTLAVDASF